MADLIQSLDRLEYNSLLHRVENLDAGPVAEFYENTGQVPLFNRDITRVGAEYAVASWEQQVRASGTAGTAPGWGAALIACGWAETVVPVTSVTYAPSPTLAFTAIDLDAYQGNKLLFACNNAVGTFTMDWMPNQPLKFGFTFGGTYEEPSDAVGSASLSTDSRAPVCKELTITLNGQSFVLKRLQLIANVEITSPDENILGTGGIQNPQIVNMDVVFEADIRTPLVATYNWWNKLTTETKVTLSAVAGSGAGNIITLAGDGYFSDTIDRGGSKGAHEMGLKFRFSDIAADTQVTLALT